MSTACNLTIRVSDKFKKEYIRKMNQQNAIINTTISDEDDKIMIALETMNVVPRSTMNTNGGAEN